MGHQPRHPFSKTSLIPTSVAIIRRDDALCPVAAYLAYTALVPLHLRQHGHPFFLHSPSSATPLSDVTFTRGVRRWVRDHLHESPDDYSGHSFRRGGATAMQLAGVPESTIAAHGRWKSLAYRTYFDVQHSLELRLGATAPLLARFSARRRPTELLPRLPPPPYELVLSSFGRSPRLSSPFGGCSTGRGRYTPTAR